MDHVFESFMNQLRSEVPTKTGLSINPLNYETFQAKIKKDGLLDLKAIASLYSWMEDVLRTSAQQLDFISRFSQNSPRFWLKDIETPDHEGRYCIGLDLETFMESESQKKQAAKTNGIGTFIPDNTQLAKDVMKEFRKTNRLKKDTIEDISFRDTAMWKSKDLNALRLLADFIQKQYIDPDLKAVLKACKIKQVIFRKDGDRTAMDFEYYKIPVRTKKSKA